MPRQIELLRLKPFLLLTFVFSLIAHLLITKPYLNLVTYEIYINANQAGMMEIFPALKNGGYSQENSRKITYPKGNSGHIFAIRYLDTSTSLRIDPSATKEHVQIIKLSAQHLGVKRIIQGIDFKPHFSHCDQASCEISKNGIFIDANGIDSKLFLKPTHIPLLPRATLITIVGAAYILAYILISLIWSRLQAKKYNFNGTAAMRLLVVYLLIYYFLRGKAPITVSILNTIVATMVLAVGYHLSRHRLKLDQAQNAEAFLIVSSALIMIVTSFSLSFTADFIQEAITATSSPKQQPHNRKAQFNDTRSTIESLYTKHFNAKDKYINLDAKVKVFGLGFTPNTKSILGQDGWYFEGYGDRRVEKDIVRSYDNITDYMGLLPFSPEELMQWKTVLEERYYWLKERGIDYIFALAPTKALIYPEKLPPRILRLKNSLQRETRYQQLIKYLTENSVVPVVDIQSSLLKVRDKHQWPLFYRTDFHWNYLGAFYAYLSIMDVINERFPEYKLRPLELDEFRIDANNHWAHRTFLGLAGLKPEEHQNDTYLKLFPLTHDRYDAESVFYKQGIYDGTIPRMSVVQYGNKHSAVTRELSNEKGEIQSMFVIGDSFAEKMTGYFSAHAKNIRNYRTVSQFLIEPIEQYRPQLVIQEILNMYVLGKPPINPPELQRSHTQQ